MRNDDTSPRIGFSPFVVFVTPIISGALTVAFWHIFKNSRVSDSDEYISAAVALAIGMPLWVMIWSSVSWTICRMCKAPTSFGRHVLVGGVLHVLWLGISLAAEVAVFAVFPGIVGSAIYPLSAAVTGVYLSLALWCQFRFSSAMSGRRCFACTAACVALIAAITVPIAIARQRVYVERPVLNPVIFSGHFLFVQPNGMDALHRDAEGLRTKLDPEPTAM